MAKWQGASCTWRPLPPGIISAVNTLLLALATITGLFYQYSLATKRSGQSLTCVQVNWDRGKGQIS